MLPVLLTFTPPVMSPVETDPSPVFLSAELLPVLAEMEMLLLMVAVLFELTVVLFSIVTSASLFESAPVLELVASTANAPVAKAILPRREAKIVATFVQMFFMNFLPSHLLK